MSLAGSRPDALEALDTVVDGWANAATAPRSGHVYSEYAGRVPCAVLGPLRRHSGAPSFVLALVHVEGEAAPRWVCASRVPELALGTPPEPDPAEGEESAPHHATPDTEGETP